MPSVNLAWLFAPPVQIENDEDVLWKPDAREKNEEVAIRGMKFLNWYHSYMFPCVAM